MQSSDIPARFPIPFANGAGPAFTRQIPTPPSVTLGRASLTDGFPPNTFLPIASGGIPPSGADFNGLFFQVTGWARWLAAGGPVTFNAPFAAAIGGYPRGSFVQSAVTPGLFFVSTAENNGNNPDTGGANWIAVIPAKATTGEVAAGTSDSTYITPLKLAELRASSAEVIAGANISKYITPASLAATFASVPGTLGYMRHPNGFIEQWGLRSLFESGEGSSSLPFPVAFTNAVFNVQMTAINNSSSNQRDLAPQWRPTGSLTTLSYYRQGDGGGGENMEGVAWRAIGN